ncbi:hypothetical protein Scep_010851 [Stephania cephalantha]|uniref:Uncharacterized protein n=1 Tax=Stephania cephalantha TaxID=152367 RepID=A0AAP0JWW7_9MAGN
MSTFNCEASVSDMLKTLRRSSLELGTSIAAFASTYFLLFSKLVNLIFLSTKCITS